METFVELLQLIVALGILNVWLLRVNQETRYRGANALTLKDEFVAYGLPEWVYYFVGLLKIVSAIVLIVGIWIPFIVLPAAIAISVLMFGAVVMHIKVHDSWQKTVPALIVLILSTMICWFRWNHPV